MLVDILIKSKLQNVLVYGWSWSVTQLNRVSSPKVMIPFQDQPMVINAWSHVPQLAPIWVSLLAESLNQLWFHKYSGWYWLRTISSYQQKATKNQILLCSLDCIQFSPLIPLLSSAWYLGYPTLTPSPTAHHCPRHVSVGYSHLLVSRTDPDLWQKGLKELTLEV